ncbi:MAG: DNRLRE domain-containing protein, partial [Ruminococcus sp.]|nr:DNRLRE domain-containing protein [Ruminococcus sp.]
MSNTKRPIYSTISILLVFLMAFLLPIEIFAETTTKNKKEKSVTFDSLAEAEAEANIVTELTNRRDEYTKHFRMDDGTIMAVTYDCPVHYKNSKGKWVEYDNSLIDETSATPDEAKAELYTNKKSDIDIDIASNTSADTLVSISTKKGNISWRYTDSKKSDVKIKNQKNIHKGNEKFTSLDKISSKATYKEFYKNIDLDCIASTIGVKENIILNNSNAQNEFEIEYEIKGLKAQKVDNQTIQIKNSNGKTIYIITAPCMYDSKDVQSTNLTLNIISNKNGKLKVKLIADKSFINEKGRAFPVTIDPEVTVSGSPEIETAQVADTSPNNHLGQQTDFWVGKNEDHSYYGFVQVKNLQENYADKNIVSAKLTVFPMSRTPEMEIEAHPISESWSNNTASFSLISNNNNEVNDTEVIDYAHTKQASANGVVFDLTKYAKKWASGSLDNNGVYLSSPNNYGQFGGYCCYYYNSRPTFVVKYKEYTGLESNLTYHTIPCGQNAEASVCDYTGSLTVKQNIYEETGARIPMSIYATHHSANINQRSYLGKGWHMSFDKRLTKTDYYYVYLDADAVEHYFKIEAGASELSDEDDLGYTLTINTENNNNTITIDTGSAIEAFDIPDEDETTHIKTETDSENSNNQITYTYDSTHRLTQIQSAQHTYTFTNQTVTSDGESVRICNNIKKDNSAFVYFVYYTGLSTVHSIKFSDGRRSQFSYNNSRFLSNIRQYSTSHDQYGNKLTFSYNNGKVSEITEFGDNNTSIHSLSVQCNDDNTTVFKADNDNNKKETYTFDNYGNTVTVLNANGMITNASDSGSLNVTTGSDSYTKNYIMGSNEPNDNDFESGHASIDNQQSSGGNFSIDNEKAYLGHKSIKIEHNASSAIYTFAHQIINGTELRGKSATFSAFVNPQITEVGNLSGKSGAMLKIECYKASGVLISEQDSSAIISTPNETGWERISVTTSVSSETVWIKAYVILRNAQGTAYFDCLQLEEGEVMNDYNALMNSDFSDDEIWIDHNNNTIEFNNSGKFEVSGIGDEPAPEIEEETEEESTNASETTPTEVATETETIENDIAEATDTYGNATKTEQGFVTRTYKRTYEIVSDDTEGEESGATEDEDNSTDTEINPNKFIYQRVAINKSDVVFNISGTAKADSVPLNNEYRTFGIALKIKYKNEDNSESHYQEFNAYTDIYQNISLSVTPNENKTVESVDFAFVYGYNKNTMTVKNAMLNYTCYDEAEEESTTATTETTEPSQPSTEENTTEPASATELE